MKFLIVDDNPGDRELITRKLMRTFDDVQFIPVGRQEEFDAALEAGDFDLVLSDYYLHWSNGLEVFRRVRERNTEVPVVMFTDSGNEEVAVQGMKMGLSDYLNKRHLERLPIAIKESLEKARLRRERDEMAERLQESEARYRFVTEVATDYAFSYRLLPDGTGEREWVTETFYRICGYTQQEIDARGGWMFMAHPADLPLIEAHRQAVAEGQAHVTEYRIRTRSGQTRWLQVRGRPIWDEAHHRVVRVYSAARDVTERRLAQNALRQSEVRFRALFANAAVGMALVDLDGYVIAANPALETMWGYSFSELSDRRLTELAYPDDADVDRTLWDALLTGERTAYQAEKRYVRKEGEVVWVQLTISRAEGEDGELEFLIAVIENITERKIALEALVQAEKLSLTGTLAASFAHEINNPMQSVIGCLALAQESLKDGEGPAQLETLLEMAYEEMLRAARIVAELRDFNRPSSVEDREVVDVRVIIDRTLDLTRAELRKGDVDAICEPVDGETPAVLAVPDRLHQVFLNLVLNAKEAMDAGGEIRLAISPTAAPAGVTVTVADTGCGIPDDVLRHLFDPFISTKQRGLGLGLYVTHKIVTEHGGRIDVETAPGEGTSFHIWLPAAEEAAGARGSS